MNSYFKIFSPILITCMMVGCNYRAAPLHLYKEPTGDNVAKLRVIGFTNEVLIETNRTCDIKDLNSGYLRDANAAQGDNPIKDKGFKKSKHNNDGYPLDYTEVLISSEGYTEVMATFTTPGSFGVSPESCIVQTYMFKPQKGELYEMRNRVEKEGITCTSQLNLINQDTGESSPVLIKRGTLKEVLGCAD